MPLNLAHANALGETKGHMYSGSFEVLALVKHVVLLIQSYQRETFATNHHVKNPDGPSRGIYNNFLRMSAQHEEWAILLR